MLRTACCISTLRAVSAVSDDQSLLQLKHDQDVEDVVDWLHRLAESPGETVSQFMQLSSDEQQDLVEKAASRGKNFNQMVQNVPVSSRNAVLMELRRTPLARHMEDLQKGHWASVLQENQMTIDGAVQQKDKEGKDGKKDVDGCVQKKKGKKDCGKGDKDILMVIDMQRDYCIGDQCGPAVDTVSKWASEHTTTVVQPIVKMMKKNKYDLVVFSQDSLNDNEVCVENPDGPDWDDVNNVCTVGSSLVTNTPGWQIIPALTEAAEKEFKQDQIVYFTKHTDDTFNILDNSYSELDICPEADCYPEPQNRKFDVVGDYNMPLSEVFRTRGFNTSNTHIDVVGVLGNRCVMKSAIHAKHLGYDVSVVKKGIGLAAESENWYYTDEEKAAGGTGHTLAREPCASPPCDGNWYKEVYSGYRGGPAGEKVYDYLGSAQVNIRD